MPGFHQPAEYDEDSPPLDLEALGAPIIRSRERIIPPRTSPSDPFDAEVLAFMKSITPLVQMEPDILNGMPVFKDTLVPVKRMFDYLLDGKSLRQFLADFPAVSRDTATQVLASDATLFYEEISKAIDSADSYLIRPSNATGRI